MPRGFNFWAARHIQFLPHHQRMEVYQASIFDEGMPMFYPNIGSVHLVKKFTPKSLFFEKIQKKLH
jgi:hypothetical protein